jgi:hypothetical protein
LTTVIALKYNGGVVLFADSQETTGNMREQFHNKIYFIGENDAYAIGCAGESADIDQFISYLRLEFKEDNGTQLYTYDELYQKLYNVTAKFCKELKSTAHEIHNNEDSARFNFEGLFVAPMRLDREPKWPYERYSIYHIDIHFTSTRQPDDRDFLVRNRMHKACIGDGKDSAASLLDILQYFINLSKSKNLDESPQFYRLSRELCALICDVILRLVPRLTVTSSAPIHAIEITGNGAKALWREEYFKKTTTFEELLKGTFRKLLEEIDLPKEKVLNLLNDFKPYQAT